MPRRAHLTTAARGSVAFLALALTAAMLTGCGRQVAVEPVQPTPPPVCSALISALPETVLAAGLRPTDAVGTAAWGEPPIVLRCGVPRPDAFTPTSALIEVNATAWLAEDLTAGTLFTAVDWPSAQAPVFVEIAVPDPYVPAGDVLADLAGAFTATR